VNIPISDIEKQVERLIEGMQYGLREDQIRELAKRSILEGVAFIKVDGEGNLEICDPYLELEGHWAE
jgi:hypothetical protein